MNKPLSRRDFLKASLAMSGTALLAACAPKGVPGTSAPAVKVTAAAGVKKLVFSTYIFQDFQTAMDKVIDGWIATKPAGSVVVERQYSDASPYWDKVQTQIASGTPPDCGIADYGRLVSYAKEGALLSLTDRVKSSNFPLNKFIPGALAQYRWKAGDFDSGAPDGDYFGLPGDAQSQIFAYNKTMFDAAGVSYPTDDWTWDDLRAAAIKLTDPSKNQYGFYLDPEAEMLQRQIFVSAAGGSIYSPDSKSSGLALPGTTEALTWYWNLIWKDKAAMPPFSKPTTQPFQEKKVAMTVEGVWWIADFDKGVGTGAWDVALLPKHPKTGKRTTSVESDGWWIYKDAKEPELAWDLVQYLASATGQKIFSGLNYIIPSCIPDVASDWYAQKPPDQRSKILDNLNMDSAKIAWTGYEIATVENVYGPILLKAFFDGSDLTQALKDAGNSINDELATAWEDYNK
jgi:multiple sugar transport system substrate-binding protein